jgi:DNA-binding GntR family transcriptional regulator
MATRNRDATARQALEDVLASERALAVEGATDYRAFLRAERAFGRVLGELSGNTVLELFLNIVYDLAARVSGEDDVYVNHPERIEQYRAHRNRMAAAILDGDEELAVLATRRCSAIVTDWMNEDLGGGGFDKRDQAGVAREAL